MTRDLIIMDGFAVAAGIVGLWLMLKPRTIRRWLALPEGAEASYALRIAGAMLFALALFLGGFSTMFYLASGDGA